MFCVILHHCYVCFWGRGLGKELIERPWAVIPSIALASTNFLVVSKQSINLSTSGHVFVLQTNNDKQLDLNLCILFAVSSILTWLIVQSTKSLNFDWSRAVKLIPNCIP